jgi:hypothetical protein
MKKLILLILISLILNQVKGQFKDERGYVNHFSIGVLGGATVKGLTYGFLANKTNLNITTCRIISDLLGVGSGFILGHLKERGDEFYSEADILYTGLGSLVGSYTVTITIGKSVPRRCIDEGDVIEFEEFPLVKK